MSKTKTDLMRLARLWLGLHIRTWSPGDGITRYHFYRSHRDAEQDCRMTESAKGLKEAWIKLEGMRDGYKYAIHKLDALLPMTCENLRSSGLQTVPFEVE